MRNIPFSSNCNCICTHSLCLLISALGTAIFTFATLVVFLVCKTIVIELAVISVIFFLVKLVALILFLHCLTKQTCRPPDDLYNEP